MAWYDIYRGYALRIAFGITILTILLLASGASALSNSGDGSWVYYKEITISNSGSALSDYQVLINLTGSSFPTNAQASGADIRFTDASGAELSYWIESWDYAGKNANIWVNVTSIPAGGSVIIHMNYGNPSAASASNGTRTFEFFDDFTGNNIDLNKWNISNIVYLENGYLKINESTFTINGIISKQKFSLPKIMEFRMNKPEEGMPTQGYDFWRAGLNKNLQMGDAYRYEAAFIHSLSGTVGTARAGVYAGSNNYNYPSFPLTANVFHHHKISWEGANTIKFFVDGSQVVSLTTMTLNTDLSVSFQSTATTTGAFYVDWVFLRKYASPEPSVSVGAEQSASPLLQKIWQTNISSTNLLWPAVGELNGDGIKDLVTGTNTRIYALNGANGQTLWTYDFGSIWGLTWPIVKDVDGDGKNEVLVGSSESSSRTSPGKIIVLNNLGQVKWMYNLSVPPQEIAADDIDGDGKTEVIFGLGAPGPGGSVPGYVYVVNGTNGSFLWSFAGHNGHQMSRVMTGDLNGDDIKEIIAGDWGWESPGSYVYAINGSTHNAIWNYYANTDVYPITVEDINNDNKPDLIFSHNTGTSTVSIINGANGNKIWGYSQSGYAFWSVAGDINGDGNKEVISRHSTPSNAVLRVFNGTTGSILWSYTSSDSEYGYPSINDVNGDGLNEVIAAFYNLTVFKDSDGSILQEIPLSAAGKTTLSEDLNGDGQKETVAIDVSGNVYLFGKSPLTTKTIPTILDPILSSTQIYKQGTGTPDHITISYPLSDADGIASATLYFRLDSGAWQQTFLTKGATQPNGYELWNATIGPFSSSGTVTFYLNATDTTGLSASNPFDGSYHSFSVVAGSAPVGAVVSMADATATQSSNVTIPIMVNNVTNLAAATIELTYNPNVVNVLSVSAGDLGAVTTNIDNTIGKTTMTAFSNTGKSGSVTFASVVLKAVGSINATSPLTLSVAAMSNQNAIAIPYTIRSGTFTISSVSKGDVNSDGQVNVIDALLISQYTVGMRTLTQAQLAAADINGDGQVTIVDALFVSQYTVGLRQL